MGIEAIFHLIFQKTPANLIKVCLSNPIEIISSLKTTNINYPDTQAHP